MFIFNLRRAALFVSVRCARAVVVVLLVLAPVATITLLSQGLRYATPPNAKNGEQIYKSGCIACHGANGSGAPEKSTEFKRPSTFPDFTKCDQTTPEPNSAWKAVIVHGGRNRGFSQIMPAFGEALTDAEINDVIQYMRGFCTNKHWARGELNLPRALVTEKAFPESELVWTTAVNGTGAPGFTTDVIHEQRFGVKNQIEIDVPLNFQNQDHTWQNGVGDVTFALKREVWSSLRTGSIFSVQGGVLAPIGSSKYGFGAGTTTFEPFAAYDQLFPTNTFLQFQAGADLHYDASKAPHSMFWRAAAGQTLSRDHRLGREWSPMVEFLADRDFDTGAKTNWDVLPQMQVTLSRRQHVRADIGVRTPMTNRAGRSPQVLFYLLWDWADGKLTEGW